MVRPAGGGAGIRPAAGRAGIAPRFAGGGGGWGGGGGHHHHHHHGGRRFRGHHRWGYPGWYYPYPYREYYYIETQSDCERIGRELGAYGSMRAIMVVLADPSSYFHRAVLSYGQSDPWAFAWCIAAEAARYVSLTEYEQETIARTLYWPEEMSGFGAAVYPGQAGDRVFTEGFHAGYHFHAVRFADLVRRYGPLTSLFWQGYRQGAAARRAAAIRGAA